MIITGGKYKGRSVILPDENIVRPTLSQIRESVFSSLFSIIGNFENKSFLDVFAGSGIMGLEAFSRGFDRVVAVEKSLKVAKILKENYLKLKIEPNIIIGDALKKIDKINETFDVIYLDPPYKSGIYELILKIIKEKTLLTTNGIIVIEHDTKLNFEGFELIKQKKYSGKFITFLEQTEKV